MVIDIPVWSHAQMSNGCLAYCVGCVGEELSDGLTHGLQLAADRNPRRLAAIRDALAFRPRDGSGDVVVREIMHRIGWARHRQMLLQGVEALHRHLGVVDAEVERMAAD